MARYEFVEGKSSKFWQIEKSKNGKSLLITWGRIGTAGQTQTKKFSDEWKANGEHNKLVDEKLKKGYRIAGATPRRAVASKNKELEAAIAEDPSDVQRWLVWADWLQQQGDPRGELIALRAKRKPQAKAYEKTHADALWGDAKFLTSKDPFAGRTFTGGWKGAKPEPYESLGVDLAMSKLGFVEAVTFHGLDEEGIMAGAVGALLESPLGGFVQKVTFVLDERYEGGSGQPDYGQIVAAAARAKPTALRHLAFVNNGYQRSWTSTGELGPLLKATPNLQSLSVDLGSIDLGKSLDLPQLRTLYLETGGLAGKNVKAIAAAEWPELEELVLYFGTDRYGGNATIKDVKALLARRFPKLTKLALCNSEHLQGQIARELVRSPLVKQLKTIDLSKGTMWDDDAPALIAAASHLKHATLDVADNYFSPASVAALKKAFGKRIDVGNQRYDDMVNDRAQYGDSDWAKESKATFRYADISE